MQVLGVSGHNKYIVEIEHTELEKYLDLYYNNLKPLKVGDVIDLSDGHRYYHKTATALTSTQKFFKDNVENIKAITNAMLMCQTNLNIQNE